MDFEDFALELSKERKRQKISQGVLARDVGISRATLSAFENARGEIGFKKVLQIADYLGLCLSLKKSSPFPTFEELRDA